MSEYHCLSCKDYFEPEDEAAPPQQCPKCASTHVSKVTLITGPTWFGYFCERVAAHRSAIVLGLCGGVLGFPIGAYLGFLMRPAIMGMQLPFMTVLKRGKPLQGTEQLVFGPLAHASFNYMLAGAILGTLFGAHMLASLASSRPRLAIPND